MTDSANKEGHPVVIAGHRVLSPEASALVCSVREIEERALRVLDAVAADAEIGSDGRWYSIGRTQIELGFMAINRSIEKPERTTIADKTGPVFSGWRLERSDSTPDAPVYFAAAKPHGDLSTWTDDAERALQFARPEDAAAFAGMLGVKVHPVAVTLEAA